LRPEFDHQPIVDPILSRNVDFVVANQAENAPALNMLAEWATNHDWPVYESAVTPAI
jgi:hypothetical protein